MPPSKKVLKAALVLKAAFLQHHQPNRFNYQIGVALASCLVRQLNQILDGCNNLGQR